MYYYLISPYSFDYFNGHGSTSVREVGSDGDMKYGYINFVNGVRPVVSLKPGTEYTSGDGSYTNPFVVS